MVGRLLYPLITACQCGKRCSHTFLACCQLYSRSAFVDVQAMQQQVAELRRVAAVAESRAAALGDVQHQYVCGLQEAYDQNADLHTQLETATREKNMALEELQAVVQHQQQQQQQQDDTAAGTQVQVEVPSNALIHTMPSWMQHLEYMLYAAAVLRPQTRTALTLQHSWWTSDFIVDP